jgi:hypothetical protein
MALASCSSNALLFNSAGYQPVYIDIWQHRDDVLSAITKSRQSSVAARS